LRSSAIRPEEEALRVQLEEIEEEVRRGRLKGKLNELWAVVSALSNGARGGREAGSSGTEWAVVDEEGLSQITQVCIGSFVPSDNYLCFPFTDTDRTASGSATSYQNITRRYEGLGCHLGKEGGGGWTGIVL